MSKTNRSATDQENQEREAEENYDGEEDYFFILGPDGELKEMFVPDEFDHDPPPKVRKILKVLGITDLNIAMRDDTLH